MWQHARLRKLFDRGGLSEGEFAARVGVSQATVNRWLSGRIVPRYDEAQRVADEFGVDLRWFGDEAMDDEPRPAGPAPDAVTLTPDEAAVLHVYRSLRNVSGLDSEHAVAGLAAATANLSRTPGAVRYGSPANVSGLAAQEMEQRRREQERRDTDKPGRIGFDKLDKGLHDEANGSGGTPTPTR